MKLHYTHHDPNHITAYFDTDMDSPLCTLTQQHQHHWWLSSLQLGEPSKVSSDATSTHISSPDSDEFTQLHEALEQVIQDCFTVHHAEVLWATVHSTTEWQYALLAACGFRYHHTNQHTAQSQDSQLTDMVLPYQAWLGAQDNASFSQRVYRVVCDIPYGYVATYGQVAALAGSPRASRIVGGTLHRNPQPGLIPCHRVVFKNGAPAPGFAFGGPDIQRTLLEDEGVRFIPAPKEATDKGLHAWVVDLEHYQWHA